MGVDDALRLAHIHENNRLQTTSHYVLLCASYFYNDTNYNRYRLYLHSCLYLLSKFNSHFHLLTGFVADKIGNYKLLLVFSILLGGFIYAPIPWLLNDFEVLSDEAFRNGISNETIQNETQQITRSLVPQYDYTFPILLIIRLLGFISWDATNT